MRIRWIVQPGDHATTVAPIVALAGGDPRAIAEGRVFIGRRRVTRPDEAVCAGDEILIAPPGAAAEEVTILARTKDVVVAEKPAGMPTIADHGGAEHSLVAAVARAVGVDASRVHPTSRLDRGVSGAVTFALSSSAQDALARARERGSYARRYVAIASRAPNPPSGAWDAPIGRARDARLRQVNGRDAVAARTLYAVGATAPSTGAVLLAVSPVTGRTHQIRVHAANAGAPLLGDRDYGGPMRLTLASGRVVALTRIALHAALIDVPGVVRAESPVPGDLREIWRLLGGEDAAWASAVGQVLDG